MLGREPVPVESREEPGGEFMKNIIKEKLDLRK